MSTITKLLFLILLPLIFASVYSLSIAVRFEPATPRIQQVKEESESDVPDLLHLNVTSQSILVYFTEWISATGINLWPVVVIVFALTLRLCIGHLKTFKVPGEQIRIIVIVMLPSVYATSAYVGLLMTNASPVTILFLDGLGEGFSSIALYLFFELVFAILINSPKDRDPTNMPRTLVFHNMFPITLLQPSTTTVNQQSIAQYRRLTVQYVAVSIFSSGLRILLKWTGNLSYAGAAFFNLMTFISGSVALITVFIVVQALKVTISSHSLTHKFLCLKVSVLFSYTQSYILWGLQILIFGDSSLHLWFILQNFIMLLEMIPYTLYMASCYSVICYCQGVTMKRRLKDVEANVVHTG